MTRQVENNIGIIGIDGPPITSKSQTHPSHSTTSRLLTSSLSLGVPDPRATETCRSLNFHFYSAVLLRLKLRVPPMYSGQGEKIWVIRLIFLPVLRRPRINPRETIDLYHHRPLTRTIVRGFLINMSVTVRLVFVFTPGEVMSVSISTTSLSYSLSVIPRLGSVSGSPGPLYGQTSWLHLFGEWAKWHVRVSKQSCKQANRLILWGVRSTTKKKTRFFYLFFSKKNLKNMS